MPAKQDLFFYSVHCVTTMYNFTYESLLEQMHVHIQLAVFAVAHFSEQYIICGMSSIRRVLLYLEACERGRN